MTLRRKKRPWTTHELAMLGQSTDTEVARRTGRTSAAVFRKRRELRIPAYSEGGVPLWSADEVRLLIAHTDNLIARYTGHTLREIAAKRAELEIDEPQLSAQK